MKKSLIIPVIACLLIIGGALIHRYFANGVETGLSKSYRIGAELKETRLGFAEGFYILDYCKADVSGDRIKDQILIVGKKSPIKPFVESVIILIDNGKGITKFTPKLTAGINPYLLIRDFNYDKLKDVFIGINSGGVGGAGRSIYQIISFGGNKAKTLFGEEEYSEGLRFRVDFLDNFKLRISCLDIEKNFSVDLQDKTKSYEEQNIYQNGKVINPVSGRVDSFFSLEPKDIDKDGNLELIGRQYVAGISTADSIGEITSVLKYDIQKLSWFIKTIDFKRI